MKNGGYGGEIKILQAIWYPSIWDSHPTSKNYRDLPLYIKLYENKYAMFIHSPTIRWFMLLKIAALLIALPHAVAITVEAS